MINVDVCIIVDHMAQNRIQELLERDDITAAQMARQLDVPGQRFRRYVRQEVNPPIEILKQLAAKFQCTVEYVAGVDDNEAPVSIDSDSTALLFTTLKEQLVRKDRLIQQLMDQNQFLIERSKSSD